MSNGIESLSRNVGQMSLPKCPACNGNVYEYRDGDWTEWICWKCGHYDSDTPAFRACPHLFHDIVRKNGNYYLTKYAYYQRGIADPQ